MTDEQKQIDEMTNTLNGIMSEGVVTRKTENGFESTDIFNSEIAEALYNAGYRKADEVRGELLKDLQQTGYIHYLDYVICCEKYGLEK